MNTIAYLGLGSNQGDSRALLKAAIADLAAHEAIEVAANGGVYSTAPIGYDNQPPFLNTAIKIRTQLDPRELLSVTQMIENAHGRVRTANRNGPRTLDIDILLFGDLVMDDEELTIPHPRLTERRFALQPIVDIDPALVIPNNGDACEHLMRVIGQIIEPEVCL